jgi:DNA-binding response OmpR family regulator
MEHPVYEFGAYRLNPGRRELSGADGKLVPLTPKAFDLLSYLVEHAGTLVTKATLMKALLQAVRRNLDRFPADFMFRLTNHDVARLRSQIVTSNISQAGAGARVS